MATPCDPHVHFVVLLGHSFISRLKYHLKETRNLNLGLNDAEFALYWQGQGGMLIAHLPRYFDMLMSLKPHAVYIEIGSNDLCKSPVNINQLVDRLFNFVHCVIDASKDVSVVIIGHVLHRDLSATRQANIPRDYNIQVEEFNRCLVVKAQMSQYQNKIKIWQHKGLVANVLPYLISDGVHLNATGQHRLLHSIKRAVVTALAPSPPTTGIVLKDLNTNAKDTS
jgi:hypothetical protein